MKVNSVYSTVFHDTTNQPTMEIINLAMEYFKCHGVGIYNITCEKWNKNKTDIITKKLGYTDLKDMVGEEIFEFSMSGELNNNGCYFSFSIDVISGVNRVTFGKFKSLPFDSVVYKEIESDIAVSSKCTYGYCYEAETWSKSFLYANDNFTSIYPYESAGKWQRFIRSEGHPGGVLRLVYQLNFIPIELLKKRIKNTTLENWILLNSNNGYLERINNKLWRWVVPLSELFRVNETLSKEGFLISFNNK